MIIGAVVALGALFSAASLASDGGDPAKPVSQAGEDRWVPSLAITSGATIQEQRGFADSDLIEDTSPSVPLRASVDGNDLAVSPFVGGALELMAPALPIPGRPRLFLSGEILPTFASDRDLALEGDPGCIRGPKSGAPCARGGAETFSEDGINGDGSRASTRVDSLVFGASLGVAFPFRIGKRQLRIKPSVGWIHYKLEADALVVDGACSPEDQCTIVDNRLRERILTASGSQRFNGIGGGVDLELDTGRFGPIGSSLFLGARGYRILGDRSFSFGTVKDFPETRTDDGSEIVFGPETDIGRFEVKVDPWMFRGHLGIRFYWLGNEE